MSASSRSHSSSADGGASGGQIQQVRIASITVEQHEDGSATSSTCLEASSSSPPPAVPSSTGVPLSSLWLLFLLTSLYFTLQLHRYSIGVVAKSLERSLHFGDGSGSGWSFQVIAGPAFSGLLSTTGLLLAWKGSQWNRTRLLAGNMLLAAAGCVCLGFSQNYLQLALSRVLQGLSQAGTGAFSASLLSGVFTAESTGSGGGGKGGGRRGAAMAVYNFGVYGGYAAAFALGNLFEPSQSSTSPSDSDNGWRHMFFVFALPAVVLAGLLWFTVKDEAWEKRRKEEQHAAAESATGQTMHTPLLVNDAMSDPTSSPQAESYPVLAASPPSSSTPVVLAAPTPQPVQATLWQSFAALFTSPPLLVLCLASSLRTGAGVVWGYDTEQFYENERHLSSGQISAWMSWVPAVFGSTGALLGGVIGDWLVREKGTRHRIGLLVCAQLLAAPCASACLLLEHPYSFLAYAVYLLVGETYIGTCYAVLMDLSAVRFHSFMTACYIFCMANLGGNASLLLPAVQNAVGGSMTTALQILWPGAVALSGVVYAGLWFWSGKARPEG